MNTLHISSTFTARSVHRHWAAHDRTLACLLALGALGGFSPAQAQAVTPTCGQVITGNVVLTGSLTCSTNPGLTILGPANVVARDFTLTCESSDIYP